MQLHNLLGYVLQTQGSSDKALAYLREAEKMIKEHRNEEQDCLLLVNQGNLAWVHYFRDELAESQSYVQEVTHLQEAYSAPPGSKNHAELNGQKGWTLLMFERTHQKQAIECFKIALGGNPQKHQFHKGLALAMDRAYRGALTSDLKEEIKEKLEVAKEMDENDVSVSALYLIYTFSNGKDREETLEEVNTLTEKLIASKNLHGQGDIIYLLKYCLTEYDKAIDIAERMLELFPNSTRAKYNLACCLRWKVCSLWGKKAEMRAALATRAIALLQEVATPHSVKKNSDLALMYEMVGNFDAAEQIHQRLVNQEHLSDLEKQLMYMGYSDFFFYKARKITAEGICMYLKAVQIPLVSEYRERCFRNLEQIVKKGQLPPLPTCSVLTEGIKKNATSDEIREFLLNIKLN